MNAPLAPLAVAMAAGILIDRFVPGWSTSTWAALAAMTGLIAMGVPSRRGISSGLILVAVLALGAGWHHRQWSDLAPDDVATGVAETARPAWIRGILLENPEFRLGERPDDAGQTRAIVSVHGISDGRTWHTASGRILVYVNGDRTDLGAGEAVLAAGSLGKVAPTLNPGEFDRREYLRAQGIRLQLSVGEPSGVWLDPDGMGDPFLKRLGRLRAWCHATLVRGLDAEIAPLAAALLLGRREGVDPDVNDAFLRTGTTHLLAISGLHLQVLAVSLLWIGRVAGLRRWGSFTLAATMTVAYAALVGPMPSVVRSTAMTVAVCLAAIRNRSGRSGNVFALAVLATLAFNPSHLFDVGCQLSFLAVAALFWGVSPLEEWLHRPAPPMTLLERQAAPPWRKAIRKCGAWLFQGILLSTVVWLITLPLVALRFHMLSPVGILLNIPLVPLTSFALMLAGLTLGLTAIWTPLGRPTAWACEWSLDLTERIVRWGANRSWGHAFTAGPDARWALAFYVVLGLLALAWAARWRARHWGLATFALLLVVGLGGAFLPARTRPPEAEVLSVGHGLAVVIQSEPGHAVLYDCGRMGDPHVGRRVIAPALWARGVGRLDAVVLSHADSDHYNGLPDLLERFSIGAVYVAPNFAGPTNPGATRLLESVRSRGVSIRTLVAGDVVPLGRGAKAKVLHPSAGWNPGAPDNDRSIVLDISHSGRRLLLTGDLDALGQDELLTHQPTAIDAFLAPHHGGRTANTVRLYDWANPGIVLVSQRAPVSGTRDALAALAERKLPIFRTWQRGALRLQWHGAGISAHGFLDNAAQSVSRSASLRESPIFAALSPRSSRLVIVVVGLLLGGVACFVLAVIEFGAWALVRPGRRTNVASSEPARWETVEARAADGTRLVGAWRAAESAGGRTAVLLHGFAEEHTALLARAEELHRLGWNLVLPDARGRGASEGEWTTFGGREAGDLGAWIESVSERVGPDLVLIAWGRSMGAAIALRAAADDPRISALVLEAPYPDLTMTVAAWLGRLRLPGLFAGMILRRAGHLAGVPLARPRPVDLAPRVRVPVLIVHGSDDPIVPTHAVRRLAGAFPSPPLVVEIPEARHADVVEVGGAALIEQIARFLDEATTR